MADGGKADDGFDFDEVEASDYEKELNESEVVVNTVEKLLLGCEKYVTDTVKSLKEELKVRSDQNETEVTAKFVDFEKRVSVLEQKLGQTDVVVHECKNLRDELRKAENDAKERHDKLCEDLGRYEKESRGKLKDLECALRKWCTEKIEKQQKKLRDSVVEELTVIKNEMSRTQSGTDGLMLQLFQRVTELEKNPCKCKSFFDVLVSAKHLIFGGDEPLSVVLPVSGSGDFTFSTMNVTSENTSIFDSTDINNNQPTNAEEVSMPPASAPVVGTSYVCVTSCSTPLTATLLTTQSSLVSESIVSPLTSDSTITPVVPGTLNPPVVSVSSLSPVVTLTPLKDNNDKPFLVFDHPPAKIIEQFDQLPEHLQKSIKPYMRENPLARKDKMTGIQRAYFKHFVESKRSVTAKQSYSSMGRELYSKGVADGVWSGCSNPIGDSHQFINYLKQRLKNDAMYSRLSSLKKLSTSQEERLKGGATDD